MARMTNAGVETWHRSRSPWRDGDIGRASRTCAPRSKLGEHHEAFGRIRAFDDFEWYAGKRQNLGRRGRALVAAVGEGLLDRGAHAAHDRHERCDHVSILDTGRRHHEAVHQAERVHGDMALRTFNLLARIVA